MLLAMLEQKFCDHCTHIVSSPCSITSCTITRDGTLCQRVPPTYAIGWYDAKEKRVTLRRWSRESWRRFRLGSLGKAAGKAAEQNDIDKVLALLDKADKLLK